MRICVVLFLLISSISTASAASISYYGGRDGLCGNKTASGQIFNCNAMTCAHRTLKFGTRVKITVGKRSAICTVNDRGPFVAGRVLDVSPAVKRKLNMGDTAEARIEVLK